MKTLKKLFAVVMALSMVLAMMTTASAATAMTGTGSLTIKNAGAGDVYTFYRVFDLAYTDGSKHTYVTNDQWSNIESAAGNYVDVDANTNIVTWKSTADADAQAFAAAIIDSLTSASTKTADNSGSLTVELPYGYYIMKTTRNEASGSGVDQTNYTVFTISSTVVTKTEKNGELPDINKTVNGKSADSVDATTIFKYTIIVYAAAGTDTYTIQDTLGSGITYYTDDTHTMTVKDSAGNDIAYTGEFNGQELSLVINATDRAELNNYDTITVTYYAKLNDNAVTGSTGNKNSAILVYEETKKLDPAIATVYTGEINFNKYIEGTTTHLSGAKFVLKNSEGKYASVENGIFTGWVENSTSDNNTILTTSGSTITVKGLDAGDYTLSETEAPSGYFGAANSTVKIIEDKNCVITNPATVDIYNTPGTALPETGGMGTTLFYTLGGALVLGAVVVLLTKKRFGKN